MFKNRFCKWLPFNIIESEWWWMCRCHGYERSDIKHFVSTEEQLTYAILNVLNSIFSEHCSRKFGGFRGLDVLFCLTPWVRLLFCNDMFLLAVMLDLEYVSITFNIFIFNWIFEVVNSHKYLQAQNIFYPSNELENRV